MTFMQLGPYSVLLVLDFIYIFVLYILEVHTKAEVGGWEGALLLYRLEFELLRVDQLMQRFHNVRVDHLLLMKLLPLLFVY